MNPPPLPSTRKTFPRQCATWSLAAPLLTILIGIAGQTFLKNSPHISQLIYTVMGLLCFLLIGSGLVAAILGISGIRQHGRRGLLGPSLVGLSINGVFAFFFFGAVLVSFNKTINSQRASQNLRVAAQDYQSSLKNSYDSKKGITNVNFGSVDRMRSQLDEQSRNLSGEDALVSQAMSQHLLQMEQMAKDFQISVDQVRAAQVLAVSNLNNPAQIDERREAVQNFLVANNTLLTTVTNAETSIRTALNGLNISPAKIDAVLKGYDSKARPRFALIRQIRACDDRSGKAMLVILNTLESDWGKWHYDSTTQKILFDNIESRETYQQSLNIINYASREEITLQGELVNLP